MEYVNLEIKDGNRVLNQENEKFQLVFKFIKKETEFLKNCVINSELIVDVNDDKIRIGIDEITAEEIIILNQKINERLQFKTLFTNTLNILLSQKSKGIVVDKKNA